MESGVGRLDECIDYRRQAEPIADRFYKGDLFIYLLIMLAEANRSSQQKQIIALF